MRNSFITQPCACAAHAADAALARLSKTALMIAPLVVRVALALPFLKSGLTKWDGWFALSPMASYLFEQEFKLHIFGRLYDLPMPGLLAWADGVAEIALPLLLGLATRLSALGLLVMTGVIQLVVPDGWANFHLPWATLAIALIAIGPGRVALDHGVGVWRRHLHLRHFREGGNPRA
jgi:putative oxidoreductase